MFSRGRRPKITSYRTYSSGDAGAVDVPRYEVYRPHRAPTIESDVAVPFVQGLIIGVLGGSCLALAGILATDVDPVKTLAVIPVCVFLAVMWRIGAIHESLWRIESVSRLDLDGDGMVGAPEPKPHIVTIHANANSDGPAFDALGPAPDLTPEEALKAELLTFIQGAQHDTSLRRWEPRLGREKYTEFRNRLIDSGYAAWRNKHDKRSGWTLLLPADDIAERIV